MSHTMLQDSTLVEPQIHAIFDQELKKALITARRGRGIAAANSTLFMLSCAVTPTNTVGWFLNASNGCIAYILPKKRFELWWQHRQTLWAQWKAGQRSWPMMAHLMAEPLSIVSALAAGFSQCSLLVKVLILFGVGAAAANWYVTIPLAICLCIAAYFMTAAQIQKCVDWGVHAITSFKNKRLMHALFNWHPEDSFLWKTTKLLGHTAVFAAAIAAGWWLQSSSAAASVYHLPTQIQQGLSTVGLMAAIVLTTIANVLYNTRSQTDWWYKCVAHYDTFKAWTHTKNLPASTPPLTWEAKAQLASIPTATWAHATLKTLSPQHRLQLAQKHWQQLSPAVRTAYYLKAALGPVFECLAYLTRDATAVAATQTTQDAPTQGATREYYTGHGAEIILRQVPQPAPQAMRLPPPATPPSSAGLFAHRYSINTASSSTERPLQKQRRHSF